MENESSGGIDRRTLVQATGAAMGALILPSAFDAAAAAAVPAQGKGWEWEPMRWVQICAAEDDPARYDPQFWFRFP